MNRQQRRHAAAVLLIVTSVIWLHECKACLIVRQEADGIRRYCHLATGNYNVRTGGVYGDLGLFTSRDSFGEDLTALFNLLTGGTRPRAFDPRELADGRESSRR